MKLVRFLSRQKVITLDRILWKRVVRCLLEELEGREDYELGIHFVDAEEMACVNQTYLHHEGSTDVITFSYADSLDGKIFGEIYISVADAMAYARQFRVPWTSELARYVVHGVLHLEGFDDKKPALRRVMKRRENRLVNTLSTRFDLSKLAKLCR